MLKGKKTLLAALCIFLYGAAEFVMGADGVHPFVVLGAGAVMAGLRLVTDGPVAGSAPQPRDEKGRFTKGGGE